VSRRQAAAVKRDVATEMERERIERCGRVLVYEPGVVRNLDQLHLCDERKRLALIASDASVALRTSINLVPRYTADAVAETLTSDFAQHGAPLAMRMDNASPHDAPAVQAVLREHEVLLLHGPARYPQYYGQHERQNREHRAWLSYATDIDQAELERMLQALNERWLRPSLGWRTAADVWRAWRPLRTNRRELRMDVAARAARLRAKMVGRKLAARLAIEEALEDRGLIRRIARSW
jgi:hypothetical protein